MRKTVLTVAVALAVAVGFSPVADAGTSLARDVARALKVAKHADKVARKADRRSRRAISTTKPDDGTTNNVGMEAPSVPDRPVVQPEIVPTPTTTVPQPHAHVLGDELDTNGSALVGMSKGDTGTYCFNATDGRLSGVVVTLASDDPSSEHATAYARVPGSGACVGYDASVTVVDTSADPVAPVDHDFFAVFATA